jgi:hypothetical protein
MHVVLYDTLYFKNVPCEVQLCRGHHVLGSRLDHRPNKNKRVVFLVEAEHFMSKLLLCKLKQNYKEALKLAKFQCTHSESPNAVPKFQETKLGSASSLSVFLAGIRLTMRARTTKTMAVAVNQ